jgi:hypothetical protein
LAEAAVPEEIPLVNASRAQYQQTEDAVHLSIPVAPAPLPMRVNFNYDYDGTDSDGEIGPCFNAVEGESEVGSDDDIGWDDLPGNEPPIKEQPEPPSTEALANQPTEECSTQELIRRERSK